jgi:hypothetical protein
VRRHGESSPFVDLTPSTSLGAVTVAAVRSTTRAGLLAGALVLAAGCSDGEATAPTTSTVTTATPSLVETTEPPPTTSTSALSTATATSIATTTTAPSTTVPESTAPPSSDAPTTTALPDGVPPRVTFPDDPDKQAVVDAVYRFSDLLFAAQANPTAEELRALINDVAGDPVRGRFIAFLDRVAADGQAFVDDPAAPSYLEIIPGAVTVVDDSGLVDACAIDRTLQVELGGNSDGSDRLIDDTVFSAAHTYNVSRVDKAWIVVDFTVYEEWEGQVGCGDS